MDVANKPKGLRLKRWQEKQLWYWRISQKSQAGKIAYQKYFEALNKARKASRLGQKNKKSLQRKMSQALSALQATQVSYLKHCRRMERYAKKGQLVNGKLYCKAGREITPERVSRYEAMCHFMVRKFVPALSLWEAAFSYDDLINQCRMEVYLALLNGYDPFSVMNVVDKTQKQVDEELLKLEQIIVYGRLKGYLRRQTWKFHPDEYGGQTCSMEEIVEQRNTMGGIVRDHYQAGKEFRFGLFHEQESFPIDFVRDQQDRLMEILDREGPEAVKKAYFALDTESREIIQESLLEETDSKWSNVTGLGGEESCS